MNDATLTHVPFDSLVYNPAINARGDAQGNIGMIVATIREKGLGQPLLVRPSSDRTRYEPVDGGGRFHALRQLVTEGALPGDHPVPVMIRDLTDAEALEMSLVTTVTKRELNPGREAVSFQRLIAEGKSVAELAAHFGVSERLVKGRLALASLPQPILQALIAGRLTLDAAQAYTVSRDEKQQLALFKGGSGNHSSYIRHQLMSKRMSADTPEAEFVGLEAYRAAGGAVDEDLFTKACWIVDPKLLLRLAKEKQAAETERLKAEGWGFVIIRTRDERGPETFGWPRLQPEGTRSLSEGEKTQLKDLRARKKALDERERLDELTGDEADELVDINEAIEALTERPFTDEQKAKSGVVIDLQHRLAITYGMMKPAEARKEARQSKQKAADRDASGKPHEAGDTEADFTGALNATMAKAMTEAMQAAIIAKPFQALAAAAAVLACVDGGGATPFGISTDHRFIATSEATVNALKNARPKGAEDVAEAFPAFAAMDDRALLAALAAGLAKLFALQTHVPAELQPLFAAFDPDVSAVWEPDEDFFKRLPRESLTAALGEAAIPDVTPSKKKRELVEMAIRQLLPLGWLPKPLRTPCYKGPGSNAWADAHAAMTADQIAAKHAPAPAPKGKAKPKAATRAKPVKKVAKSPARKTTKRKGK